MKHIVLTMAAVAGLSGVYGCATPPVPRIYTLQGEMPAPASDGAPDMVIELTPVALPERLRRRQIVVRQDGAQVQMLEQHRWSASLGDEMQDALSSALQRRLRAVDMARGGIAGKPDYRISVEFSRLDARLGGAVQAEAAWSVKPTAATAAQVCLGRFEQQASGAEVSDVVAAHQRVVAQLADAIAASVRAAASGTRATNCAAG
ncbi:membrane integrity-associated transporter subunit PqiC [Pigmentiphaga sp.]|jgi:Uncharacterized protein conserved in bacteria|uniref:PqiC family protein n=1 Tax=Pigmentiphaga sp. TaxID=1977564 RepID=UPI0025FD4895|nr:PqiC family protein [Pigmentiphaga sp.]MBX6318544.1 membrane integrity-associated transporter subunit PqiC [Pigmentiphaga sp.]